MYQTIKKRIRLFFEEFKSDVGYLMSHTFLYSIYFNFRYLPFRQAKYFPIIIRNTKIIGRPKITIECNNCYFGMIKVGEVGYNLWATKKSILTFWDNGCIIFRGDCKSANSCHLRVLRSGCLTFGNNFYSSSNLNVHCADSMTFGNNVTLGWNCTLTDTDYHHYYDNIKKKLSRPNNPIFIGDNCWLGFSCIVTKGSILNNHTIVGAGSVISCNFTDSNIIIKGNPAQIVRRDVSIDEKKFW